MKKRLKALLALPTPLLCGIAAAVLWLVCAAGLLLFDTLCYATGRITQQTVTLQDTALYTLDQLEFADAETLVSTEGDSKLFLSPGQPVRRLRLEAHYSVADSEMDLYYHLPGRGYSQKLRVWPTQTGAGEYTYTVPFFAGQGLRLDLCDHSGVRVTAVTIHLNEPLPWYGYFIPTLWQLFWLAAGAGLAACAIELCRELFPNRKYKTR
jgi:hypothetical protein